MPIVDHYGVAVCKGDSDSKAYFSVNNPVWYECVLPLFLKENVSTFHVGKKRCRIGAERSILKRDVDDVPRTSRKPNRVFPVGDMRNLYTLLSQVTLFPVTPVAIRQDGTKVLVFPNIDRKSVDADFKASNTLPQLVRRHSEPYKLFFVCDCAFRLREASQTECHASINPY